MAGIDEQVQQLNKNVDEVLVVSKAAKTAAEEAKTKQAEMIAQLKELNDEKATNQEWRKEAEEHAKKQQEGFNEMAVQVKLIREQGLITTQQADQDFGISFAKAVQKNFARKDERGHVEGISLVTKGKGYSFELDRGTPLQMKAAANMTTTGNLTGDSVITYVPTPVLIPRPLVNFRDLVPSFQSATGTIAIFRENYNGGVSPQEGAFGQQTTQGALKEQVGYDFTHVNFTANYIGGFVRISKQMLQDLPFLQTYLPSMLLRDYYKFENSVFYAAQVAAALGTHSAGGNAAETFIKDIALLEQANFAPNGIVVPPLIWANLMMTRLPTSGTSYSWPGGIYMTTDGNLAIAGIPIIKATWLTANTALIADWTQSQIATVDGLRVEFFEQDSDNVQRNLITVRVEARVVLVTGQPYAFTNATSGLGTGA